MLKNIPSPRNVEDSCSLSSMLESLKNEKVNTWFDLGLLLDRIRENPPRANFPGSQKAFNKHIRKGGVGILSFYFTIDGITVEAGTQTFLPNSASGIFIHGQYSAT